MSDLSIDLRHCRTVALNLPTETRRRESVVAVCAAAGLPVSIVEAIQATPGRIGCALSHLKALRGHASGGPLLVLEDDVGLTEDFRHVVSVPADADALFLGVSDFGALDILDYEGFTTLVAAEDVDESLVRVHNLLSAHAILYISDRFRIAATESIVESLADMDWAHDKGLAKIQSDYKIYALRRPMFYQAAEHQRPEVGQHQEDRTRVVMRGLTPGVIASAHVDGRWRDIQLVREDDGRLRWAWL